MPDALLFAVFGGLLGGLTIFIWWTFFSRAPKVERYAAIPVIILAMGATFLMLHPSIAKGMAGLMFLLYAIPIVSLALVAWAVASRSLTDIPRRVTMIASILLACGGFALLRTNGISGDAASDFAWRWSKTAEDRLLARPIDIPPAPPIAVKTPDAPPLEKPITAPAVKSAAANWPGFRGSSRNSSITGTSINTNWIASPPVQMWRQPIGPGWSSFAVSGDLLYTQEQRGEDEVVACYKVSTGKLMWKHADAARFWESNAGAGPRATPTLHNGRAYTFGATGIVNALDARTGTVVWTRNAATDSQTKIPGWGFSSSPLVMDDLVVIAAAGKLIAYDLATGEPRWSGPTDGGGGYSSPHPITIDGVPQILLLNEPGIVSLAVADGKKLWQHPLPPNGRVAQPALTADGDLLVGEGEGKNLHRLAITHRPNGWAVEERWTSAALKPYFNDLVVHKGHAYGFDGSILACIDLNDGKRKWKGGRYGHGQMLLLADQDLLLVLSEEGELALVSATADQFTEVARVPAITGKTWNHPVLAGEVLLVRNGEEMAAFRITPARR